jgi:hypothetical protein
MENAQRDAEKEKPDCYPLTLNRMGTIAIFMTIRIE